MGNGGERRFKAKAIVFVALLFSMVIVAVLNISYAVTQWSSIQIVDSTEDVGKNCFLALDLSGYPHISYFDSTNFDLKYAAWNGSHWSVETIDSPGIVGGHSSLALDSLGNPHISYYDQTNMDLKYATWTGSTWNLETVNWEMQVGYYSSIALDSSDHPHISYRDSGTSDLLYARWTGSTWDMQTIDSGTDTGGKSSLALDSSNFPHISYCNAAYDFLKYARWTGSAWLVETVDSTGAVGYYSSLALDSLGNPHISYQDETDYDLKYAMWNGSSWNIDTIDLDILVGVFTSLALDSNDNPHISFYDQTNGDLLYARWTGSAWLVETVDSNGFVGSYSSLALDSNDNPHISFYDQTNGDLKYTASEGPSPTPTPMPTTTPSPSPTSSGMWSRIYEDHFNDRVDYLIQTSDGGYAIAGNHYISGEEKADFWIIKTDLSGNIEWNKRYNRTDEHFGIGGLAQTSDGGYAIASKIVDNSQNRLASLIKIDDSGNIVWEKDVGSGPSDIVNVLIATSDGGLALAGQTLGFGSSLDFWLVKTDSNGNLEWNYNYGQTNTEIANALVETSTEGFALAGYTYPNPFDCNSWLLKTDSAGNLLWNKTYENEGLDVAYDLVVASDGGFAFAGVNFTSSSSDFDYWLIKTNVNGDVEWKNSYKGTVEGYVDHVGLASTLDGGLALAGMKGSWPEGLDTFLLKTDVSGVIQWNQTHSLPDDYMDCNCLVATSDGGFALSGQTLFLDIFLIKTDEYGIVSEAARIILPLLVLVTLAIFISKKKLIHKQ